MTRAMSAAYRAGRKLVIGVTGLLVLVLGIAMIVLPGPAIVVIPLGLGILAAEFTWARRWLRRLRENTREAANGLRRSSSRKLADGS